MQKYFDFEKGKCIITGWTKEKTKDPRKAADRQKKNSEKLMHLTDRKAVNNIHATNKQFR